ncbi:histidinol-phosphate transaminase [Streptomyces sp. NPDC019531]|uniref:histidinol-phosphate transaminase n=1 Tax=Streptomyces sp. NPDC019531 TaxID=3365062 RepID=UPI0038513D46
MTHIGRPNPAGLPGTSKAAVAHTVNLANNELAFPPLPAVAAAVDAGIPALNRYPSIRPAALTQALASHLGVAPERVAVGAGSGMLLQHLMQSVCRGPSNVVYGWPSFEGYPLLARIVGAEPRPVRLTAGQAHDLDAMLAAITPSTRMVVICNPNNPTGTVVHREEVLGFLHKVPEDVVVVLDEAYHEFVGDPDSLDGVGLAGEDSEFGNVVSLRTFSKAYGLAGLRVGYCVAAPAVVAAVHEVQLPFTVSALAEAAAVVSLSAEGELALRRRDVDQERSRMLTVLGAAGYEVVPSQGNFLWLPLAQDATRFAKHCMEHNVLVRPVSGEGIRVTVGASTDNDMFLAAASSYSTS